MRGVIKMDSQMIFKALCTIVIIILIIYHFRRQKKFLSVLIGAITGGVALFIVNKYGTLFSVDTPLSLFNISGSCILGVPFVLFIVIMNFL